MLEEESEWGGGVDDDDDAPIVLTNVKWRRGLSCLEWNDVTH